MEFWHGTEEINGFEYDIDTTSLQDVKSIRNFIVFNYWQSISAKITVEIIHESGMRLFGGTITGPPTNEGDWKIVLNIVKTLEDIVGSSKFKISLAEFQNNANDLNFIF